MEAPMGAGAGAGAEAGAAVVTFDSDSCNKRCAAAGSVVSGHTTRTSHPLVMVGHRGIYY